MSTFFEKLTQGQQTNGIPQNQEPEIMFAKSTPPRNATHLKVEDSDAPTIQNNPSDEEGELTVDIYDKGDAIIIQSTIAGVKPDDLDISITSDTVTIRGVRDQQEEVAEKNYYYKELFWGTFSRSVILPEEIDPDAAEAVIKHGLLTIRLPKKKRGTIQKLKVKVT